MLFSELLRKPVEKPGLKLDPDFRGKFLRSAVTGVGLDVVTIALKQGRDHGIPGYTAIRKQCGLEKVRFLISACHPINAFPGVHLQRSPQWRHDR